MGTFLFPSVATAAEPQTAVTLLVQVNPVYSLHSSERWYVNEALNQVVTVEIDGLQQSYLSDGNGQIIIHFNAAPGSTVNVSFYDPLAPDSGAINSVNVVVPELKGARLLLPLVRSIDVFTSTFQQVDLRPYFPVDDDDDDNPPISDPLIVNGHPTID